MQVKRFTGLVIITAAAVIVIKSLFLGASSSMSQFFRYSANKGYNRGVIMDTEALSYVKRNLNVTFP